MKAIFFFIFLLVSQVCWSFPELSRHGYVNCTSCHISPSGGGLLNEYGRELSKELVSTWAREGEQKPAWGLINPSDEILIGAYLRGLQLHRENATVKEGRPILMQADAEIGYVKEKIGLVVTVGRQEALLQTGNEVRPYSRRHYVLYRAGETQNIRAGRFQKYFGLNDPNHNSYIRRDLGFGQDTESYNLEYSYLGENIGFYITGLFGNFEDKYSYNQEKGFTISSHYYWAEKQKVGFSFLQTSDASQNRSVSGLWAIIAWTEKFFSMSEIDYQNKESKTSGANQFGYVTSNKLVYEVYKGVLPFILYERANLDRSNDLNQKTGWALGLQFLPRPHFEFIAQWENEKLDNVSNSNTDIGWLMLNIYL